jgi:hypothetical protein
MKINFKYHPYLLSLLLIVLTASCKTESEEKMKEQEEVIQVPQERIDLLDRKTKKLKNLLIGKNITSLDSILSANELNKPSYLLLYYSSIDCSTCIHTGLDFLDQFANSTDLSTGVILTGTYYENGPLSQVPGFIHDHKAQIQDEAGYILTPSLIHYNKESGVKNLYLIPTFKDSLGLSQFQQSLIISE